MKDRLFEVVEHLLTPRIKVCSRIFDDVGGNTNQVRASQWRSAEARSEGQKYLFMVANQNMLR